MAERPTPVIDAAIDRVKESRPLVGAIVDGLRNAIADQRTTLTEVEQRTVDHVAEAVAPIIVNAGNQEPARQSRVVSGSVVAMVAGILVALGELAPMIQALEVGFNENGWPSLITFLVGGGAFGGGAFALFGRLRKGLPPMTLSWNPFSWLAPRATP